MVDLRNHSLKHSFGVLFYAHGADIWSVSMRRYALVDRRNFILYENRLQLHGREQLQNHGRFLNFLWGFVTQAGRFCLHF